jgi:hypothetical protein
MSWLNERNVVFNHEQKLNPERYSTVELIFKQIREGLESSTLHLVPNIVKSKYMVVKILLAFCFLAYSVVCVLLLVQSFTNFDVITTIRTKYLISMTFPVVMICKTKVYNQNLTNLVKSCQFNNKECDYQQDFSYLKDPHYGDCFRFNSGQNMKG